MALLAASTLSTTHGALLDGMLEGTRHTGTAREGTSARRPYPWQCPWPIPFELPTLVGKLALLHIRWIQEWQLHGIKQYKILFPSHLREQEASRAGLTAQSETGQTGGSG